MPRIQGRRPPRLEPRDRVWIARMRELAAQADVAEERALARRSRRDDDDIEDAEFEDRPVRALARRERELAEPAVRASNWVPLAIGLGVVALIGVAGVVVYLLVRRKDNGETSVLGAVDPRYLPPPQPQVYLINAGGTGATVSPVTTAPAPVAANDGGAIGRIESMLQNFAKTMAQPLGNPTMHTYALPNLATRAEPIRLATATKCSYDVTLRVVGPAGSFAAFSTDTTELNRPDMPAVPTGNTVIVQSGQTHTVRILKGQAIYGKGQAPNAGETVFASVTANEAATRFYG